jgi:hypothetical protein
LEQPGLREVWGFRVTLSTSEEMKKDSAKKLLTKWVVPLVFELLKGVAKGAGLLLLSHLLR